jgi:hypothetical protein
MQCLVESSVHYNNCSFVKLGYQFVSTIILQKKKEYVECKLDVLAVAWHRWSAAGGLGFCLGQAIWDLW